MEGTPLSVENDDDKESRRKKELEERERSEKRFKKPESLGFLAVESKPAERRPSALEAAWARTERKTEEEEDEKPDKATDAAPARVQPPVEVEPPVFVPRPARVEARKPEPAEASEEEEPPAAETEDAEPGYVPDVEPVKVPEIRLAAAEPAPEEEPPAPAPIESTPDREQAPAPEPEAEPEPESEVAPEPAPEREPAREPEPEPEPPAAPIEVPGKSRDEELRINHGRGPEEDAEEKAEEQVAEGGESAELERESHEPELEAAPEPEPVPEREPAREPEPEPEPEPEAEAEPEPEPEHADARPFEFKEGADEEPEDEEDPDESARPKKETVRLTEEQVAPERLGRVMLNEAAPDGYRTSAERTAPEVTKSSRAAEERMKVETSPKGPLTGRRVESLNGAELMAAAAEIMIDGRNLREIYESHLIGEQGLRRLIAEHTKGEDLREALRREVMEHEMDFERDPAMRDIALQGASKAASQIGDSRGINELLQQANADSPPVSEKAAYLKARAQYETDNEEREERRVQHKAIIDIALFGIISILTLLVIFIYIKRS